MSFKFSKHYTVSEAQALLPQIREWLAQIEILQQRLAELEIRLQSLAANGCDLGGDTVNSMIKLRADLHGLALEFSSRHIYIKDASRGLVDFPALRDGKEVFLCWEKGEETIEHWHDLDSGYSGREPLD